MTEEKTVKEKTKAESGLIETYWAEASYWAMMAAESIERKALREAQEDVERLKERLEWVAKEMEKNANRNTG